MNWLLIIAWVVCGVLNYGIVMAYGVKEAKFLLRMKGHYSSMRVFSLIAAASGIFGLFPAIAVFGIRNGLRYRKPDCFHPNWDCNFEHQRFVCRDCGATELFYSANEKENV